MPTLRQKMLLFTQTKVAYLLNDNFTDTRAAGAVNGTLATPTGGTRIVADTNSKLSIGSGVVSLATGGTGAGNPGLWYSSYARTVGRILISKATPTTTRLTVGFDGDQSGDATTNASALQFRSATGVLALMDTVQLVVSSFTPGTVYFNAVILRAAGNLYFIKGGTFTNWTLLYPLKSQTQATNYPTIAAGDSGAVGTVDFIRIPTNIITVTPLASDAFTRSDGALGNTGGGGSEESGGSGLAWTAVGTWAVATNKAACSALTGAGFATVNSGSINVIIEAVCTRTGGNTGIVARYADADNYIIAYHDGTNAHLDKVVAGTPTSLINAAVTYSASARTILSLNGTGVRLYYNDALIGAQQTVSDAGLQTGTAHGLYTTDTGATFDNFVVFARGNGGEYESTFNKFTV